MNGEGHRIKLKFPNGVEFEGTLEDYKSLKADGLIPNGAPAPKQERTPKEKDTTIVPSKKYRRHEKGNASRYDKAWLNHENIILKQFWDRRKNPKRMTKVETTMMMQALPGRTKKAISIELCKLKKSKYLGLSYNKQKNRVVQATPSPVAGTPEHVKVPVERLTPEEFKATLSLLHLPINEIARKIKRSSYHLEKYLKTFGGLRKLRREYNVEQESRMGQDAKDKITIRMRFIGKRAGVYMKQYNWSREKACKQASDDWTNGGRDVMPHLKVEKPRQTVERKKFEDVEFPKFIYLSTEGNDMLYQMVKNVIANKGTIRYRDVSHLPRHDETGWTRQDWLQFVDEFMKRSARICQHFLSHNKFKLERAGNDYEVIQYQ